MLYCKRMNWNKLRQEINQIASEHRGVKAQLSRALQITPSQVTQYLTGQVNPSLFRQKRFEQFLTLIKQEIEEQLEQHGDIVLDKRVNSASNERKKSEEELNAIWAAKKAEQNKLKWAEDAGLI